jgi:hypothetical protein
MGCVRIAELDQLILDVLARDHPEIVGVRSTVDEAKPVDHNRVRIDYASGGASFVMVHHVTGPGVPSHEPYDLPTGV